MQWGGVGGQRWAESQEEKKKLIKNRSRRRVMVEKRGENRVDRGADEGGSSMDWWEIEGKNR